MISSRKASVSVFSVRRSLSISAFPVLRTEPYAIKYHETKCDQNKSQCPHKAGLFYRELEQRMQEGGLDCLQLCKYLRTDYLTQSERRR